MARSQDKAAQLPQEKVGGRYVTAYNPHVAMRIVERIAEGELLKDICAEGQGMPHRGTFHRWVVNNAELARAYGAARELSAQAMEEEAIDMARAIRKNPGTSVNVRAYEVAMNQLRWSAQRRDPSKYGDKAQVSVRVPVQINTQLNLGTDVGGGSTLDHPNIYQITASVNVPVQAAVDRAMADPTIAPLESAPPRRTQRGAMLKRALIPHMPDPRPFSEQVREGPLEDVEDTESPA